MFDPMKLFAFEKTALVVIEGIYLLAVIFYSPPSLATKKALKTLGLVLHILATLLTACFLVMRFFVTGHAPFVVFYETIIFLAFSISFVFLTLSWRRGVFGFGRGAAGLSWLLTIIALIMRLVDQSGTYPRYLVPQLSNSWFEPHAAAALLAYGFFVLAFFAALTSLATSRTQTKSERRSVAEFFLWPGVVVFTVSLMLGGQAYFTEWGTWWTWQPKWISSLAVWLLFVTALAIRRGRRKETVGNEPSPHGKKREEREEPAKGRQKGDGGLFCWLVIAGFIAVLVSFLATDSGNHKFL